MQTRRHYKARGGKTLPKKSKSPHNTRKKSKSPSPKAGAATGAAAAGCPANMNNDACLAHTITAIGFTHLESPDDGNCFFTSLETYFKLMESPLAEKDHMELRQMLVDYLLTHLEKFRLFVVKEYKVKSEKQRLKYLDAFITKEIKEIAKPNVYDTQLGDIVPQEATNAFNIRIVIHNWRWSTLDFAEFDLNPDAGTPEHTIHLLRINENHFDLLFPTSDFKEEVEDRWNMIQMMRENNNNNNNNNENNA
jgi:hypothetical protein